MNPQTDLAVDDLAALVRRLDGVRDDLARLGRDSRGAFGQVVWTDAARHELDREVAELDRSLSAVVGEVAERVHALRRSVVGRGGRVSW